MSEAYEIVKEGTKTLLIRELANQEKEETEIVEKYKIRGILHAGHRFRDGREYVVYDISGKRSLAEVYEGQSLTGDILKEFLLAIQAIRETFYEYLLPEDSLVLDPEYIFVSSDMTEYFFLFRELTMEQFSASLRALSEFMILHVLHEDAGAVAIAYRFFSDASCDCINIKELLEMSSRKQEKERQEKETSLQKNADTEVSTEKEKHKKLGISYREKKKENEKAKEKKEEKYGVLGVILPCVPALLLIGAYVYFPSRAAVILAVLVAYIVGMVLYFLGRKKRKRMQMETASEIAK